MLALFPASSCIYYRLFGWMQMELITTFIAFVCKNDKSKLAVGCRLTQTIAMNTSLNYGHLDQSCSTIQIRDNCAHINSKLKKTTKATQICLTSEYAAKIKFCCPPTRRTEHFISQLFLLDPSLQTSISSTPFLTRIESNY